MDDATRMIFDTPPAEAGEAPTDAPTEEGTPAEPVRRRRSPRRRTAPSLDEALPLAPDAPVEETRLVAEAPGEAASPVEASPDNLAPPAGASLGEADRLVEAPPDASMLPAAEVPEVVAPAIETAVPVGEVNGAAPGEAFLAFYACYGPTLCGEPISGVLDEDGVPTQYFRHLALESPAPGVVRLKALGEAWLAQRRLRALVAAPPPALRVVDLTERLPRHPSHTYARRPLSFIRYLVIHHTGAPEDVGPEAIAAEHVTANGWPGIGYHFVIDADGVVYHTQDLTVVSYHAAQFNPAAVGIALAGDFTGDEPAGAQLDAAAELVARLCRELGLPAEATRGHREMVPTPCPGDRFVADWKPRLLRAAGERLAAWAMAAADGAGATPEAAAPSTPEILTPAASSTPAMADTSSRRTGAATAVEGEVAPG